MRQEQMQGVSSRLPPLAAAVPPAAHLEALPALGAPSQRQHSSCPDKGGQEAAQQQPAKWRLLGGRVGACQPLHRAIHAARCCRRSMQAAEAPAAFVPSGSKPCRPLKT